MQNRKVKDLMTEFSHDEFGEGIVGANKSEGMKLTMGQMREKQEETDAKSSETDVRIEKVVEEAALKNTRNVEMSNSIGENLSKLDHFKHDSSKRQQSFREENTKRLDVLEENGEGTELILSQMREKQEETDAKSSETYVRIEKVVEEAALQNSRNVEMSNSIGENLSKLDHFKHDSSKRQQSFWEENTKRLDVLEENGEGTELILAQMREKQEETDAKAGETEVRIEKVAEEVALQNIRNVEMSNGIEESLSKLDLFKHGSSKRQLSFGEEITKRLDVLEENGESTELILAQMREKQEETYAKASEIEVKIEKVVEEAALQNSRNVEMSNGLEEILSKLDLFKHDLSKRQQSFGEEITKRLDVLERHGEGIELILAQMREKQEETDGKASEMEVRIEKVVEEVALQNSKNVEMSNGLEEISSTLDHFKHDLSKRQQYVNNNFNRRLDELREVYEEMAGNFNRTFSGINKW